MRLTDFLAADINGQEVHSSSSTWQNPDQRELGRIAPTNFTLSGCRPSGCDRDGNDSTSAAIQQIGTRSTGRKLSFALFPSDNFNFHSLTRIYITSTLP